ncbi:hypothetical protein [Aureivirga marina]|uniref:hypothetical protein n=1 Tax=Aureivirga marina TaxID=1182451 RepID=UPI0018C93F04|nr:hypothetical protein [Aureivirga marina]
METRYRKRIPFKLNIFIIFIVIFNFHGISQNRIYSPEFTLNKIKIKPVSKFSKPDILEIHIPTNNPNTKIIITELVFKRYFKRTPLFISNSQWNRRWARTKPNELTLKVENKEYVNIYLSNIFTDLHPAEQQLLRKFTLKITKAHIVHKNGDIEQISDNDFSFNKLYKFIRNK